MTPSQSASMWAYGRHRRDRVRRWPDALVHGTRHPLHVSPTSSRRADRLNSSDVHRGCVRSDERYARERITTLVLSRAKCFASSRPIRDLRPAQAGRAAPAQPAVDAGAPPAGRRDEPPSRQARSPAAGSTQSFAGRSRGTSPRTATPVRSCPATLARGLRGDRSPLLRTTSSGRCAGGVLTPTSAHRQGPFRPSALRICAVTTSHRAEWARCSPGGRTGIRLTFDPANTCYRR